MTSNAPIGTGSPAVLVTGASSGIGRATALDLARMGAHVAIVGRDRQRTEAAARDIRDASSVAVDVLINNVGGYWNTRHVTADGLERTFAVNHLAPFLLTNLLLGRLKQSAPARVVTVSSNAHRTGRIEFDDLQGERSYSGSRAYDQSKLANVLFAYELAKRLRGTGVTSNALHPGVVRTSFGADDPAGVQRFVVPLLRPLMKSPARGAATSIHLATAPELEGVTGAFFANGRRTRSSKASYDESDAARLWRVSAELVGLPDGH